MKVLFAASIMGHIENFHVPYMQYFKDKGFEVHTAASGISQLRCIDRQHDISFERSPFKPANLKCYKALKKAIDENGYDIIHCHTPVVSVLTRLAARRARRNGTVVIYTSHGFHFYKGAPRFFAWLFRLAEKWLSRYTDLLITINSEDYQALSRYGFKPGASYQVPGVGVDNDRFSEQTAQTKRESRLYYHIDPTAYVLVFAAEYAKGKDQIMLLEAVSLLKTTIPDILLLLPGEGPLRQHYEQAIKSLALQKNVWLMGYRNDMDRLLLAADVAVSSSLREGMGINLVEAMAVTLPVVATRIRGHVDLIADGQNGFLVNPHDAQDMADRLAFLYKNPDVRDSMREKTRELVKPFLLPNARTATTAIYDRVIENITAAKNPASRKLS